MKKRGKVLRVPGQGPGLLIIEGQQYWFRRERVWKSEVAAKPGLSVDVTLDQAGKILTMTVVPESQLAEKRGRRFVDTAKGPRVNLLRKIAAKCGMPNLLGS